MTEAETAAQAIRDGALAVLPTDTVYGLVCNAVDRQPALDLYRLKGRSRIQPTALVLASLDDALRLIPELGGRSELIAGALLPGPVTLVVPNPARRFSWLCGDRPEAIGVRVPTLAGLAAEIVARLGAVVASSANLHGGPDPRRLDDVPSQIRAAVALSVDGGELPGTPSTVVDITGDEPVILRAGTGDPRAVLARIRVALTQSLPHPDGALTTNE